MVYANDLRHNKVMEWSNKLAYAIGLIVTDGNLSKDGRHIVMTSKDKEQIINFINALEVKSRISVKGSSFNPGKKYFYVQLGNVKLYRFLLGIGITPNKTKTIGEVKIPDKYFIDFLRGHLDGDGCTYSYWDKRWKSSFMLYTTFYSASIDHIKWLRRRITELFNLKGAIKIQKKNGMVSLTFAKKTSSTLLKKIYYQNNILCLARKRLKIEKSLDIINQEARVLEW